MLIMTLSYTQKTNDQSLIKTYVSNTPSLSCIHRLTYHQIMLQYNLLDQWTQFLITDSLIPANQFSTDDFAGQLANQTNLAIKGIIGIKAMSQIASLMGDSAKSSNYSVCFCSLFQRPAAHGISMRAVHRGLVRSAVEDLRDVYGWVTFDAFGAYLFRVVLSVHSL